MQRKKLCLHALSLVDNGIGQEKPFATFHHTVLSSSNGLGSACGPIVKLAIGPQAVYTVGT